MESRRRSIAKTFSWRFIATIVTTAVTYLVTSEGGGLGKGQTALLVGLLDTSIKFGVYFFHERAWNKIDYGREIPPKTGDFDI